MNLEGIKDQFNKVTGNKSLVGESRHETLADLHLERYAVITGSCIFLVCSPLFVLLLAKAHVRLFVFDWLNKSILSVCYHFTLFHLHLSSIFNFRIETTPSVLGEGTHTARL